MITHRLSTIRDADKILVINEGGIIERATRETLLAEGGFYHNLYISQFKGNSSAAAAPVTELTGRALAELASWNR